MLRKNWYIRQEGKIKFLNVFPQNTRQYWRILLKIKLSSHKETSKAQTSAITRRHVDTNTCSIYLAVSNGKAYVLYSEGGGGGVTGLDIW